MSVSSFWRYGLGVESSRLNTLHLGSLLGLWSPRPNDVAGEWIQVDFGTARQIQSVATQGRHENRPYFNNWVTSYKFSHSDDGSSFSYVLDSTGGERNFTGNTDRDTVVTNDLNPPITARYFRLVVQTWNRAIGLRWELYGCNNSK